MVSLSCLVGRAENLKFRAIPSVSVHISFGMADKVAVSGGIPGDIYMDGQDRGILL